MLLILYLNYSLSKKLPKEYIPTATWVFNIGVLFANELCRGYSFGRIYSFVFPQPLSEDSLTAVNWGTWLDGYGGLIPRWEVLFNITVLRLISFNMDYYWSLQLRNGSPVEVRSFPFLFSHTRLTPTRRSNLIFPTSLSVIVFQPQPKMETTHSAIILPMSCILHSILLGP